jgi:GAF domain-containing protein
LATVYLARRLAAPLLDLTSTVGRIAKGEMALQAALQGPAEVVDLARAFNSMTAQLRGTLTGLEQRVAERTRNLQAAAEVSRATTEMLEVEILLPQIVELVRDLFDLYYVGLFLLDQERSQAVLRAGTGEAGQQMLAQDWQLEVGGDSMIGRCIARGMADIQLDVGEAAVHFDNPFLPETRSEMALPLRSRGEVIGAVTIQSIESAAFDETDISTLQNMADQIAAAIYNDRLFAETQTALARLQATQRRYQVQAWSEYARSAETLVYETVSEGVEPLGDTVLSEVAHPQVAQPLSQQKPAMLSGAASGDGHAALVAPVVFRGEVIGALGVHDEDGTRKWTEQEVDLVQAIVDRMGQAAENLRLLDDAQRREARERTAREVADEIRGALTVDDALQRAAKQLGDLLGAEIVAHIGTERALPSDSQKEGAGHE